VSERTRAIVEAVKWRLKGGPLAAHAAWSDGAGPRTRRSDREHLDATLAWLERAHDATGRKGVARSYALHRHPRYGCTGWLPAYPETTGYIVPTLYDAARLLARPELAARATEMSAWESEIQMASGAVRGGTVADPESPAVFNTGQVLFGWVDSYAATKDKRFLDSAARAARWLVANQDPDGAWRRGASRFATPGGHVYNARAAWGLCRYAVLVDDADAKSGARRAADFAVANALPNGWYDDNCLTDPKRPLTHTIAYAAQGLLEMGVLLQEPRYVDAARNTARSAAAALDGVGKLPGRLDRDWRPAVDWACVTGEAQMVLVWDRLASLDAKEAGAARFREAADRALAHALSTQHLDGDEGVRGGVPGSFPIWGGYGTYEYLNWAAKFLADALLGRVANVPGGTRG
jgi:hypothetical protein